MSSQARARSGDGVVLGAAGPGAGQLEVATQPLLVGHLGDVAEVGLAGVGHRRDQLVLAGERGLGVAGDLVEQRDRRARRALSISWMSAPSWLRPEVMLPSLRPAPTQPTLRHGDAGGVDEQLLDGGGGGGLLGGHRGGADEHAVDGHGRSRRARRPTRR